MKWHCFDGRLSCKVLNLKVMTRHYARGGSRQYVIQGQRFGRKDWNHVNDRAAEKGPTLDSRDAPMLGEGPPLDNHSAPISGAHDDQRLANPSSCGVRSHTSS